MNLLARACGLQERIRPISSVSRFVHTVLIQPATFAPLKRWLLMNQPEKSSWSGTRRIAPASSHILPPALGEGSIDPPLPLTLNIEL